MKYDSGRIRAVANPKRVIGFAALLLFACSCYGQQQAPSSQELPYRSDEANLGQAISKLHTGNYGLVDMEIIAKAHATGEVPDLEREFARVQDVQTKAKAANVLVRLGDADPQYWNFLVQRVNEVLADGAPDPFTYDANGKMTGTPSNAYLVWAKNHNIPHDTSVTNILFDYPVRIAELSTTDDPRAIPYLRRALRSNNPMVTIAAAQGLAQLRDAESIPVIIDACKKAPAEVASALAADSLIYFDNTDAQRAADAYVPADRARIIRDARAHGKTPLN